MTANEPRPDAQVQQVETGAEGSEHRNRVRPAARLGVENIDDPLMQKIRYLDKLVDERRRAG
jgi:Uncharacterized protein conserved in bacteria (DUF2200)